MGIKGNNFFLLSSIFDVHHDARELAQGEDIPQPANLFYFFLVQPYHINSIKRIEFFQTNKTLLTKSPLLSKAFHQIDT